MNIKFICIALLLSSNLLASSYFGPRKAEITFTSYMPEPFGIVKVSAKLSAKQDKLEYIKFIVHGDDIILPAYAFADISYPNLSSIQLLYLPEEKTKFYLYLEYWSGNVDDPEKPDSVKFVIENDKLVGRIMHVTEQPGTGSIWFETYEKTTGTWKNATDEWKSTGDDLDFGEEPEVSP